MLLCSRLARALSVFDSQWVQFEDLYIKDLICIETRARVPLEKAVEMEIVLLNFEHAKPKESLNSLKRPVAEQSVHHLPVPRRRHTASDASGRVAAATAATAGTASSHGTQLSLPRHSRHVPGSSSSPPSNLHSREESIVFPEMGGSECPRSRQHTLSGELPSMAMASQTVLPEPQEATRKICELKHLAQSAVARGSTRRNLLEELVARVNDLNACANARGKGRSDMTVEVLEAAAKVFLAQDSISTPAALAHAALARSVLEGFLQVRRYLSAVCDRLLWIDPQLCMNAELENALVAWEDAWELASSFLLKMDLCDAICGVAVHAARACELEPSFANMIDNQDAELFLILPRLVLLSGLQSAPNMALAQSLMPDLEVATKDSQIETDAAGVEHGSSSKRSAVDRCLADLLVDVDWDVLTWQVIKGPGNATGTLEAFLLELEALSMELQRKEPQKWNRCSSVLLHCICAASRQC